LRPSTISVKKQTMRLVKEFKPSANFENMTMAFYDDFTNWLAKKTIDKEPQFDGNTIGKHVKELKAILNLAYTRELISHNRFHGWAVQKEKNEVISLSKEEVLKINGLELTGIKKDVRDIFIMACFLGPRIGDFGKIKPENFAVESGVHYFSYVQEKTGAIVKIPVNPIVQKILKDGFPKMIAEQNFRYNLKEICKTADLTERVVVKIRGDKPEYKKKWEAISPHSARRTFASALFYGWFHKPMPASFCMRYTGHKSEKSFMLYIGATEADLDTKALEYFDIKPKMAVA
jgi:integrase